MDITQTMAAEAISELADKERTMSFNYNKYKAMSRQQLQKAVSDRKVTVEYLIWLGILGPGKQIRGINR